MDQSESTAANPVRRSRRRWFQFSLRGLLTLLSPTLMLLNFAIRPFYEQHKAVKAIEAAGGTIRYEERFICPEWLQALAGNDLLQDVVTVKFLPPARSPDRVLEKLIPMLRRLPRLRFLLIRKPVSEDTVDTLKAALPHCTVHAYYHEI